VSAPTAPDLTGRVIYAGCLETAVGDDLLYVPTSPYGLAAIEIDAFGVPDQVGVYDEGGHSVRVDVVDGMAYMAARYDGVRILDVSDPGKIVEHGHWSVTHARDVKVVGDYAYVAAEQDGFRVLDVSDPDAPFEVGHVPMLYANGLVVRGDNVYVSDRVTGVVTVDISDPTDPIQIGQYDTYGDNLYDIAIRDSYLFLAYGFDGIRILRVNNPASPLLISTLDTEGFSQGIAVQGDLVAVADGADGIRMLHVADPASPIELGRYDTKGTAAAVDLQGDHLYVASYPYGVIVLDIADPTAPVWAGIFDTAGMAQAVVARQNMVYLVDMEDGLWILDHDQATSVDDGVVPSSLLRLSAYPNPFNPQTRFSFTLPAPGFVELAIYTPAGRRVSRPFGEVLPAGAHAVTWRGLDDDGRPLPSGVYLARLKSGGIAALRKIALIR